jgi:hypothetical protein
MQQQLEPGNQANVEYFFRLLYEWFFGDRSAVDFSALQAFVAHIWLWIIIIGYLLSVIALFLIVYTTMRLFDLRKREAEYYGSLITAPAVAGGGSPRWEHIQTLAGGASPSEWREAIIEADIMLDEMLTRQGYVGDGVGEKLKAAEPADFHTLRSAWEAHKVRNQIAHEGSAFQLSQSLVQRTLQQYEAVFREFDEI